MRTFSKTSMVAIERFLLGKEIEESAHCSSRQVDDIDETTKCFKLLEAILF